MISVAIEADVEMGGLDQTFNILAGRDLQRELGQDPQIALFMPLLVGLDGIKKMSKSLGNYVGITESPDAMFGKLMSISDALLRDYFVLCTDVPLEEIEALLSQAVSGQINPKDVKRRLAREIISLYHSAEAGAVADQEWNRIHAQKELPTDMLTVTIPEDAVKDERVWVCKLLVVAGMAKSNGEARRLIEQGGVFLNGEKVSEVSAELPLETLNEAVLRVGPRRFARLQTIQ